MARELQGEESQSALLQAIYYCLSSLLFNSDLDCIGSDYPDNTGDGEEEEKCEGYYPSQFAQKHISSLPDVLMPTFTATRVLIVFKFKLPKPVGGACYATLLV